MVAQALCVLTRGLRKPSFACGSLLLLIAACGGTSRDPADATDGGGGGRDGSGAGLDGGDASGRASGGRGGQGTSGSGQAGGIRTTGDRAEPLPRPVCPDEPPSAGDSCDESIDTCTYGQSANLGCRAFAKCESGTWSYVQEECAEEQPEACPSAAPENDSECTGGGLGDPLVCLYESGVTQCLCFSCDRLSRQPDCVSRGTRWVCKEAPPDLDCPAVAPNIGDGCNTPGKECTYGDSCSGGGVVFCRAGAWELGAGEPCGS